ncbi:MAG: NAD(P)H-hydrate dehydratase, partial [SAR202 cluster bacterium]|nr:NAD(P)H-hydrate dehydratase [SAR202 cluster bacterium]
MKIVTSEQMKAIEARAGQAGVSADTLMENAGLAVATAARRHIEQAIGRRFTGQPVLVLVGPGNNGGDGLVAARHLFQWFARPTVYLVRPKRDRDPKLENVHGQTIPIIDAPKDSGLVKLRALLDGTKMVVDAFLGTGSNRPIDGEMKAVLAEVAAVKERRPDMLVLALDVPSGLDADTGAVDPATVAADVTVTLGYPKAGLFTAPGSDARGIVETVDIGIPAGVDDDVRVELMTPEWAGRLLPKRPGSAHKGTFGKSLVVAGSRNYVGAAYLAATAATRVGAGLVTLALPESIHAAVASRAAEPTYLPLPESAPGELKADAASQVLEALSGYDALLVGCGVGQARTTRLVIERILFEQKEPFKPLVLDADGLNILSSDKDWWKRFTRPAIVTPHPGEMARLLRRIAPPEPSERISVARGSAKAWNKVVVLKGAHTVVAYPDGRVMV